MTNVPAKIDSNVRNMEYFDHKAGPSLAELVERDADKRFRLKVSRKEPLTHDTYAFDFEFPNPEWISGLQPNGHFMILAEVDGELRRRPYTPVTPVN